MSKEHDEERTTKRVALSLYIDSGWPCNRAIGDRYAPRATVAVLNKPTIRQRSNQSMDTTL